MKEETTTTPILSFDKTAGDVRVDLPSLISSRLLIQANSGGGKSRLIRQLCEQTHGSVQQIILDPEGEFATLREKFDYVLAGKDGDIPSDAKTAKLLARRIMELGASAVIDLYDLQMQDRRKFVRLFLEELMRLPRSLWRPLIVVIDEAHIFAPERGAGEAESLEAVLSLCTQGRKRGYCAVLATQRISKLHKDAAAELLNRLIGRTGLDIDLKRAGDELGLDKDGRLSLRDLNPGEFFAFGPAISRAVQRVRAGQILTTHPQPGTIGVAAPPPPEKVKRMLGQLAELAKESEEELRTIADRDRMIAQLKAENRKLAKGATERVVEKPVADTAAIEKAVGRALENERKEAAKKTAAATRSIRSMLGNLERVGNIITVDIVPACKLFLTQLENGHGNGNGTHTSTEIPSTKVQHPRNIPAPRKQIAERIQRAQSPGEVGTLPPGERATLTAACQYPDGVTRQQLTILTGYKRSSRDAYIQRLRTKELIEIQGDKVIAAQGAEELLGDFQPLPTGDALRDYWLDRLPDGERAVLEVLIENYPDDVSRETIDAQTGYKRSSRDAYIQRMKAKQIIEITQRGVRGCGLPF